MTNKHQGIRIGQILVEQGKLTEQQVFEIIEAQRRTSMPFGLLAERTFDVTVDSIEQAWVEQYCRFTGQLDLDEVAIDQQVLKLINRRQAWQVEILPVRYESEGELLGAASRHRRARARWATGSLLRVPGGAGVGEAAALPAAALAGDTAMVRGR